MYFLDICVRSFQAPWIRLVSLNFTYTQILLCSIPMSHRRYLPLAICNYFLPVPKIFVDASKINIHFLPLLSGYLQDNTTSSLEGKGLKLSIRLPSFSSPAVAV